MLSISWFPATSPPKSCRGVITHAPSQARECPQRNAFSTPDLGVLQRRFGSREISRFDLDSGRSRKLFLFGLHILCNRSTIRERFWPCGPWRRGFSSRFSRNLFTVALARHEQQMLSWAVISPRFEANQDACQARRQASRLDYFSSVRTSSSAMLAKGLRFTSERGYDFQVARLDWMLEGHGLKLIGVWPLHFGGRRGPGVWLGAAIDFTLRVGSGRAAGRGRPD